MIKQPLNGRWYGYRFVITEYYTMGKVDYCTLEIFEGKKLIKTYPKCKFKQALYKFVHEFCDELGEDGSRVVRNLF